MLRVHALWLICLQSIMNSLCTDKMKYYAYADHALSVVIVLVRRVDDHGTERHGARLFTHCTERLCTQLQLIKGVNMLRENVEVLY